MKDLDVIIASSILGSLCIWFTNNLIYAGILVGLIMYICWRLNESWVKLYNEAYENYEEEIMKMAEISGFKND